MHLHNCVNEGKIYISTTKNENGQYETAVFPRKVVDMVWAYAIYEIQYNKQLYMIYSHSVLQATLNHFRCIYEFGAIGKYDALNQ